MEVGGRAGAVPQLVAVVFVVCVAAVPDACVAAGRFGCLMSGAGAS